MHGNHNFKAQENQKLQTRFPAIRHHVDNGSRGLQNHEGQPEMAQDAERPAAALSADSQLWLDFCFENFEMLMNTAGCHAAKLAVNEREIGKDRQTKRQHKNTANVCPEHHQASPNRRRSRPSTRSISPRSVS